MILRSSEFGGGQQHLLVFPVRRHGRDTDARPAPLSQLFDFLAVSSTWRRVRFKIACTRATNSRGLNGLRHSHRRRFQTDDAIDFVGARRKNKIGTSELLRISRHTARPSISGMVISSTINRPLFPLKNFQCLSGRRRPRRCRSRLSRGRTAPLREYAGRHRRRGSRCRHDVLALRIMSQSEKLQSPAMGGCRVTAGEFSDQRIRPVSCMTTNKVIIEPIVTAKPLKPLKKMRRRTTLNKSAAPSRPPPRRSACPPPGADN